MRLTLALVLSASLAACSDASDTVPSGHVDPNPTPARRDASADPIDPVDPVDPPSPTTDGGTTPRADGDEEPTPAELAIDPGQTAAACNGPFNCKVHPEVTNGNRVTNPNPPGSEPKDWPIAANTEIVDGLGGSRGTVTEANIQINYGQRKMINGASYVYAFSVKTTNGAASSWVLESAVTQAASLKTVMPTLLNRDPGKGDYEQVFTLTGGDPALYGDAKVVKNTTLSNDAATDYLTRPGNVVNILSALPGGGGVSNDTYPIGKNVEFHRARGVASVYIYLYTKGTDTVIGTQRFMYGHVNGRYGWVARDALSPAAAKPGPTSTFCCAKCASRAVAHRVPLASECTTSATSYCAAEPTRGAYESSSIGECAE